jgi:hypothetical protein
MKNEQISVEEQIRSWADDLAQRTWQSSESPVSHSSRQRRWPVWMAAATLIVVGLAFGLWVRKPANERLALAPGNESATSEPSTAEPTPTGSYTSTVASTTADTETATTGVPVAATTAVPLAHEAAEPPQGAVELDVPELESSAVQAVIGEPGSRELLIVLVGGLPYDPSNLCTRHYRAVVDEAAAEIVVHLDEFRPPGEMPLGCRAIGAEHNVQITLASELGARSIIVLGRVVELSRP